MRTDKDSLTSHSNSLSSSGTKYGNDNYAFENLAKKRVDRPDQVFTPAEFNERAPIEEKTFSTETNISVTDVKDVAIAMDNSN